MFDIFTKWYILLPLAFSIGPIFSLSGIDGMVHVALHNKGGGQAYINKNTLTKNIDAILRGTPYWLFASAALNIFWGASFPWMFASFILFGAAMKIVYGRKYMNETNAETLMMSSREWNFIGKRGFSGSLDEVSGTFTRYAYPSLHTITILAAIFFSVHDPSLCFFVAPLLLWMLWVNHHWLSDILSGICLVMGAVDFLKFFHML